MGDTPSVPQPIVSATEPRRWIAAIVGGVVLGEALWSLLQILVRDWATPALTNAMGQGPTRNPGAFEPLPLVIAFVEACVAAILLVLLMAWAQRRVRVVVRTVPASSVMQVTPPTVVPPARPAAVPVAPPVRVEPAINPAPAVAAPIQTPVAAAPAVNVAARAVSPQVPVAPPPVPATPVASAPVTETAEMPVATAPQPAAPVPPQPKPAAVKPAPPKKPKTVYYNSVGEPIEE